VRLGSEPTALEAMRLCPEAALASSWILTSPPSERELLVLKGRRGERVSFEEAGRNAWQSPPTAKESATSILISCLVQPSCNREPKLGGVVERHWVKAFRL
jgi:hypothetical protein